MFLELAPIRGVTDYIFRNIYSKYFSGFDSAMAPFITTFPGTEIKEKVLRDIMPENNEGMRVIPQIIGKNPDEFIVLAKKMKEIGYDEINWNLGCPHKMVAKRGRGSGLLPNPEIIEAFLEKVVPAIPNRLSVKIRLGRKSVGEVLRLIPVFNKFPLSEVTIHARTGIQMYEGKPYVDIFENIYKDFSAPVVYNGDIFSVQNYNSLSSRFPELEKWMVGRGALINPFLPEIIKGNFEADYKERLSKVTDFHNHLFDAHRTRLSGPAPLLGRMKEFWNYYALQFEGYEKPLKKILKSKTIESFWDATQDFLKSEPEFKL
ncbi:MAG: tRNA dihydrouridine synthase [Rhodothermaceae bacterium]